VTYQSLVPSLKTSNIIYEDSFKRNLDKSNWEIGIGVWKTTRKYGLVNSRGGKAIIWFRKTLHNFILEFDAYSLEGSGFSIILCGLGKGGRVDTGYQIGFGEQFNTTTFIKRLGTTVMENNKELIEHEKKYHVKVIKSDKNIQFYLDKRLIFNYVDEAPLTGKYHCYLGVGGDDSQNSTIAIGNIRIATINY